MSGTINTIKCKVCGRDISPNQDHRDCVIENCVESLNMAENQLMTISQELKNELKEHEEFVARVSFELDVYQKAFEKIKERFNSKVKNTFAFSPNSVDWINMNIAEVNDFLDNVLNQTRKELLDEIKKA
jgi:hypothetical protein